MNGPFSEDSAEVRAYLAAIVNSSDDVIISKNLDGVITSWNRAAEKLFGYTSDEAIGKHIGLIVPQEKMEEEYEILDKVRAGHPFDHFETVRRTREGRLVDVSLTISPIHDTQGKVIGISKVARDISDRKKSEQLLAQANRRRDEFLANMSHELRTPMNAIIGLSHILSLSDALRPRDQQCVAMMRQSADGLLVLINDLLDFAKIDQGVIDIEAIEFDLSEVVGNVVKLLNVRAREKGFDVHLNYDSAAGDVYIGDPFRIQQILNNLIGNAVKFTEQGAVTVTVRPGDNRVWQGVIIEIADTGIGIAPEKLDLIFEKFTQADSSMTRKYGGSGLGLSIGKALAERMEGSVTATSTPGLGSIFTVRLPLQRGGHNVAGTDKAARQRAKSGVLIVDDYEPNVLVVSSLLDEMGVSYDVAHSGTEALRKVVGTAFDVILMDVQMPGMDGYECTRRIREMEAEQGLDRVPIVAMTAHVRAVDRSACFEAGMTDFIAKPFVPADLVGFLDSFMPGRVPSSHLTSGLAHV
jgi:PAS domain S-box-containing protein